MYNRYIPTADGTYRRQTVAQAETASADTIPEGPSRPSTAGGQLRPAQPDLGDLLVILILLLVLSESDGNDAMGVLIAMAAFLFLP